MIVYFAATNIGSLAAYPAKPTSGFSRTLGLANIVCDFARSINRLARDPAVDP